MVSTNAHDVRTGMISMLVAALVTISGCSAAGVRGVGDVPVADARQAVEAGEARLTCGLSCAGAWGFERRRVRQYLDLELWRDLETLVAQVGFEIDQTYYYLGRAAEGLGRASAASTYYRLALATPIKCDVGINACDGLDVPALATAGIERLAADAGQDIRDVAPPPSTPPAQSLAAQAKRPDCVQPGSQVVFRSRLRYPREAKMRGLEGTAVVEFIVEADGAVAEDGLRIRQSSGVASIDEAALAFLRGNRFPPGRCNGVPTRMGHEYVVSMRLGGGD